MTTHSPTDLRSKPAVTAFVEAARRYCALIDVRPTLTRRELVSRVHAVLAELYSRGLELPEVEPQKTSATTSALTQDEWWALFSGLRDQLRDYDSYWVSEPEREVPTGPGPSSLADDLADIYRDLKTGFTLWEAKPARVADAVWEWRFGCSTHWGRHAVDALGRIHTLVYEDAEEANS
jgi:hypothetical protein